MNPDDLTGWQMVAIAAMTLLACAVIAVLLSDPAAGRPSGASTHHPSPLVVETPEGRPTAAHNENDPGARPGAVSHQTSGVLLVSNPAELTAGDKSMP